MCCVGLSGLNLREYLFPVAHATGNGCACPPGLIQLHNWVAGEAHNKIHLLVSNSVVQLPTVAEMQLA